MFFPELITGSILILCGFLIKPFPNLLAGYNMLSKAEKKRVDINGLSSFLKIHFIILGILVILIGFILNVILGVKEMYVLMISSMVIMLYVIYLTIRSGKYYNAKN